MGFFFFFFFFLIETNVFFFCNIQQALSKEEQQPYYDVTEMTNELEENEKKAIDKEIISLRPGKRQYSGYKISRRISQ